jgi:glycosyltransferase involved in cell wall biosynthesis
MSERELVSIVIPCYEQARFLPRAIESALGQSYSPVEVIVVDDGSPDDTAEVAANYPEVQLLRTRNQGVAAARNSGLEVARGSLLVFLDADDILLSNAVADGVACFEREPDRGMVFGRHERIDPAGNPVQTSNAVLTGDPYEALLRWNIVGCPGAALYRRRALEAVGGFSTACAGAEDYEMYLRLARRFPISQHDATVVQAVVHDANMQRDFALMLRATVVVLRGERAHVRAHPAYRHAYRQGLRAWRETFGVDLARQAVRELRSPASWRSAGRDLVVLFRFYPGVVVHAARRAPALIGRRLSARRRGQ